MKKSNEISFTKGIGGRSIFTVSILITFFSFILSLFFTSSQKKSMEEELIKRATALANNLAYNSSYWVLTNYELELQKLINGVMNEEEIIYAYISDQNSMIISHKDTTMIGTQINLILNKEIYNNKLAVNKKYINDSNEDIIEIISPIEFKQEKRSVSEEFLFEDANMDGSHSQTKHLGWAFLGVSLNKLNKAIADIQKKAFIITFIIVLAGISLTIITTRLITKPIRELMDATRIVARGNLDYYVNINRKDEIGILAKSFNRMTSKLKKSRDKIENWNRMLESKVIKRTKELSKKNLELQKNSEDLQKALEELKSLDKSKDDFLSLVSHELRTPLSSIVAYTELLLDDMANTKDDEKKYLGIIKSESDRLTRLINNVLDLSKMEAGRMPFEFSNVELKELVNASVAGLTGIANKHQHTIVNNLNDSPVTIFADHDKIIQVISNILSNSIKFTPDGGLITISGDVIDSMVTVSISDNGVGIKKRDLDKVFDKFQQIENVDHHSEGTGLGMPISKLIVEKHKGNIWISSKIRKGTTVYFTLPIKSV